MTAGGCLSTQHLVIVEAWLDLESEEELKLLLWSQYGTQNREGEWDASALAFAEWSAMRPDNDGWCPKHVYVLGIWGPSLHSQH